ncbi:TPA: hypothetical protein N0F65_006032 [Lagenidium giganteum]|uniref:Protein kinase domain-containing protein n=1 Tax=Lagenidium giganteum TaxID=4803 RepID=A0AAV2Z783_9STRA|nr:TPA: hypothetical protein N0F65_006032 [Lagenidium giganteum]
MHDFFRGLYDERLDASNSSNEQSNESISSEQQHLTLYGTLVARRLDEKAIKRVQCIGSGGFAIVWLVTYQGTTEFASKRLLRGATHEDRDRFVNEILLNASLAHSRIVKFIGVAWSNGRDLQALFEYMEGGDLRAWLTDIHLPKRWTREKVQIATDIIEALVYVHSFQPALVHRDLKSRNVLLGSDLRAKLCDFGIARFKSTQQTMTMSMGTGLWIAPEVIAGRHNYDQFTDIYSFGVLLSELDTHLLPYEGVLGPDGDQLPAFGVMYRVGEGSLCPSFTPHCPPPLLALARQCLSFDPAERPTAIEVAHVLMNILDHHEIEL